MGFLVTECLTELYIKKTLRDRGQLQAVHVSLRLLEGRVINIWSFDELLMNLTLISDVNPQILKTILNAC